MTATTRTMATRTGVVTAGPPRWRASSRWTGLRLLRSGREAALCLGEVAALDAVGDVGADAVLLGHEDLQHRSGRQHRTVEAAEADRAAALVLRPAAPRALHADVRLLGSVDGEPD